MGAETPGWVTPATLVVIAVLGGLAKLIHWMGKVEEHRKGADEHRKTVSDFMAEIRGDIKQILGRLSPSMEGASPLRLTPFGEKMSEWLKAKAWAASPAPSLRTRVEGMQPAKIDLFCREYVRGIELGDDWEQRVIDCAYEFGTDSSAVHDVLHIELRDALLK